MAGSDIKSGHLHSSGFIFKGRARVRALDTVGSASAGLLEIWDTSAAPVTGTYGRSGTTVTVASTGHGLSTGDVVGISFEPDGGVIATPGNYVITVTGADAFTIADINSGTIANDPDCRYVATVVNGNAPQWLGTYHTSATDIFFNGFQFPDEGMLAKTGIYVFAENLASINIYYA
jgi:hypothetical protein